MTPEQRKRPVVIANIETATPSLGLAYRSEILPGSVDVTGATPEEVHVDPELTEGHSGHEESGDSEIISTERLSSDER